MALALAAAAAAPARADDWPHWRGPQRNGVSAETGWLDRWPGGPPIAWTAEVGTGFSSFAVAGGRAYTLGHDDGKDRVFCLDAETGRVLWSHAYPSDLDPTNNFEGGPTATPAVDGDRVYTLSRWGDVFAFEAARGKVVWSKNVQKETGAPVPSWGFSGSPLVLDDLLVLNLGAAGAALDKATGRLLWKSAAEEAGYSTPFPLKRGEERLVLLGSGTAYLAVDPRTGREAWSVRWLTEYGVNAADPVADGDRLFLSSGYGKGAALLKLGAGGPEVVWQNKSMRNQMNPSVLLDGHLYGVDGNTTDRAKLKCLELATGQEKWAETGIGNGSVAVAGGRLIVLSDRGELMVAPATPDGFAPTARARVLEGKCWTVPVLAHGRIYCRSARGDVACVDARKK